MTMQKQFQKNGLTVVELIVTACALGTLLSITLPAIQLGREGAGRTICQDNLQTIGVASAEYDDAFGELPPYMGIPTNQDNTTSGINMALNYQLTYSLTQLLDFIGRSDLTEQVDPFAFSSVNATIQDVGYSGFTAEWLVGIDDKLPGIAAIAFDEQIPEYRCPSDSNAPTNTAYFGPHPTNNASAFTFFIPATDEFEYSVTNYVSNAGALFVTTTPTNPDFAGLYGPIRSRQSDSADTIPDGASNVILFGESLGGINKQSATNRRYSMAMGGLAAGQATLYPTIKSNFGTPTDSSWIQFASAHPDVVNFVFADGSVKSINRNIHSTTIGRLCGAADGLPLLQTAGD